MKYASRQDLPISWTEASKNPMNIQVRTWIRWYFFLYCLTLRLMHCSDECVSNRRCSPGSCACYCTSKRKNIVESHLNVMLICPSGILSNYDSEGKRAVIALPRLAIVDSIRIDLSKRNYLAVLSNESEIMPTTTAEIAPKADISENRKPI